MKRLTKRRASDQRDDGGTVFGDSLRPLSLPLSLQASLHYAYGCDAWDPYGGDDPEDDYNDVKSRDA